MICVFDIETIPDFHLLREVYGYEGTPLEIALSAFEAQKERSGSEFLPLSFHRVVSISSVISDDYGHFSRVGHCGQKLLDEIATQDSKDSAESKESKNAKDSADTIDSAESADSKDCAMIYSESSNADSAETSAFSRLLSQKSENEIFFSKDFLDLLESTLISEFWKFMNKINPKLVSFNGRGFDLPLLTLRAMRYNITASAYFETDDIAHNKTKWENYRQRYSEKFHTDLFDCLGHFGTVRALNLDTLCKMLDIVGKYDINGSQVYEIYLANAQSTKGVIEALNQINHYCHSDVLNTYWLYLKYELVKGTLLESDYLSLLDEFSEKLPKDMPYSAVFVEKIQSHLKVK